MKRQAIRSHGNPFTLVLLAGLFCLMILAAASTLAQDGAPSMFATNTPQPTAAPLAEGYNELYALPQWLEGNLINILIQYIQQVRVDDPDSQLAVRLLQRELEWRFPGAPHQQADRQRILEAMLAAPRGTVDMRTVVRPFIEEALNQQDTTALAIVQGFQVEISAIDLDGLDPVDAVIHTRYPAEAASPADILYEEYALAIVDGGGFYRLLSAQPDFPIAPYGRVEQITLQTVGDVNLDTLDEMVLSVEYQDAVNQRLLVYGLRNEQFVNMIPADAPLDFVTIDRWLTNPVGLDVTQYRLESAAWGCISENQIHYEFIANRFRQVVVNPNRHFTPHDSLACRLSAAEPFFSIAPADAIVTIEDILAQSSRDEPDSEAALQRAQMILAMLYALDGQPSAAIDMANMLDTEAAPGSWLQRQSSIFIQRMTSSGTTALSLCAQLDAADVYGACDIDQVLGYTFAEFPLNRDEPLAEQLASRGLNIIESVKISALGRVDRTAVRFDIPGAGWWAFAPVQTDSYTAEQIDPPVTASGETAPAQFVDAPPGAFTALLADGDLSGALTRIETAVQNNPGLPLSASARYLQALTYDLAANRASARDLYFTLWQDHPQTLWGQLAAAHLERR